MGLMNTRNRNSMKTCLGRLAAACVLVVATGALAESTLGSTVAHTALDFRITIPPVVKAEARADPASLQVTAGDVERGYVDLDGASSLVLTSNAHQGFMMAVAIRSRPS